MKKVVVMESDHHNRNEERSPKDSLADLAKVANAIEGEDCESDILVCGSEFAEVKEESLRRLNEMKPSLSPKLSMHFTLSNGEVRTEEQFKLSFLRWAWKEEDNNCNVSKAFRRLESFEGFVVKYHYQFFDSVVCEENDGDLSFLEEGIGALIPGWEAEGEDFAGCALQIIDLSKADIQNFDVENLLRKLIRENLRRILYCVFDPVIQLKGVVLIVDLNGIGLKQLLAWRKVFVVFEKELNEMQVSCAVARLKMAIIVGAPFFLFAVIKFMKLFMSKKVSSRFKCYPNLEKLHAKIGGSHVLPVGCMGGTRPYFDRFNKGSLKE